MCLPATKSDVLFANPYRNRRLLSSGGEVSQREVPVYQIGCRGLIFGMRKTILLLFMTLAPVCAAYASDAASLPNTVTEQARNKAIAGRVFEEIFNQGRFEVADEIYASDFVNHGQHRDFSLEEDQAAVHSEKKAFPDLRMTVKLMVAEGDLVTAVWTLRGTHTGGGYAGLPPTGARIEVRGITVWRIVDGKIREEWTSMDQLDAYLQVVTQLKWQLLGLSIAAVFLVWALCRAILRPRRTRPAKVVS